MPCAVVILANWIPGDQGIAFTPLGVAVVKAVMLAKFMLFGNAMGAGERTSTRPLI